MSRKPGPTRLLQVDAFTDRPFAGNPAGVCVLDEPADAGWMQCVAREMNLSETAFLVRRDGEGRRDEAVFDLRWFTPMVEVELCGHATLASAHALWEEGLLGAGERARFSTLSGRLEAARHDGWIEMDFPAEPAAPTAPPPELPEILGARLLWAGRNRFDLLVELEDEETVRALRPDIGRIGLLPDIRGLCVTARASSGDADFVSRFFAPAAGVPEDPVTGSAHCCLGPYWADQLGRDELVGHQVSARGGVVRVAHRGARVGLAGQAVTVLRLELVA